MTNKPKEVKRSKNRKYICSVCKEELSQSECEKYFREHEGLELNWGQCQGKDAYPIFVKE